jgi:hypothetical protein
MVSTGWIVVVLLFVIGGLVMLIQSAGPLEAPKVLVIGPEPPGFADLMNSSDFSGFVYEGAIADEQLTEEKFASANVFVFYGQENCPNFLELLKNQTVFDNATGEYALSRGISVFGVGNSCFNAHSKLAAALNENALASDLSLGGSVEATRLNVVFTKQESNAREFVNVSAFNFNGAVFNFKTLSGDVLASFSSEGNETPALVEKTWLFNGYYFAYSPFNSALSQESNKALVENVLDCLSGFARC